MSSSERVELQCKLDENLSNLSFEELQNLKERLGSKVYSEAIFGARNEKRIRKDFKRANKNRPREETSKRAVKSVRDIFNVKKEEKRDPRFDEHSGTFDERIFEQTYRFVGDIRRREKDVLEQELQEEDDDTRKEEIKYLLTRLANHERAEKLKEEKKEKKRKERQELVEQLKEGKKPVFIKKSDKRKMELAEKYQMLKKSGKLEKYMQKRRKKNAAKDRKLLPGK